MYTHQMMVVERPPHKPILAEQFKTKMCQNYEKTGSCPYEIRCMFAHGAADLRTKEMNLADNLVTEENIKAFLARQRLASQAELSVSGEKNSILAERFKTKLCQNFELSGGVCPYEHKCMFAHGAEEMRTTEMNVADGLTTETAIRDFQQAQVNAAREAHRRKKRNEKKKAKAKAAKLVRRQELLSKSTLDYLPNDSGIFPPESTHSEESVAGDFGDFNSSPLAQPSASVSNSDSGANSPIAATVIVRVKGDYYRHNPYSPMSVGLRNSTPQLPQRVIPHQSHEATSAKPIIPPPAVSAVVQPAAQSQHRLLRATSALFPLANVLQQIRRQRRATSASPTAPTNIANATTNTASSAQAHMILLP